MHRHDFEQAQVLYTEPYLLQVFLTLPCLLAHVSRLPRKHRAAALQLCQNTMPKMRPRHLQRPVS